MGDVVAYPAPSRPVPGDCAPYVKQAARGIRVLVAHNEMADPDWENLAAMQARCLRCGQCPLLAADLLMAPRNIVRRPGSLKHGPPREPPVLRMSRAPARPDGANARPE